MIRFALVSVITFGALGGVFFLSSSHAKPVEEPPSKHEALFR